MVANLLHNGGHTAPWTAPAVVWPALVLLSAGTLALSGFYRSADHKTNNTSDEDDDDAEDDDDQRLYTRIPLAYDLAGRAARVALFAVAVLGCVDDGSSTVPEASVLGYVLVLDAVPLVVAAHRRAALGRHVHLLVFLVAAYAFAQLAPVLVLASPPPSEAASPWLLLKLAAAALSLLVAFVSPRPWTLPPVAFELAHRSGRPPVPSPEQTASWFSYGVSYGWLTRIVRTGAARRLAVADLLPVPAYDEPLVWRRRILAARRRFGTTLPTLAYTLRHSLAGMVGFAALTAVVEFVAPLGLYRLLAHIQDPATAAAGDAAVGGSSVRPWVWVALLFLGPALRSVAYQQYIFTSTRLIVRTRLCLIQEIYAKAARIYETADQTASHRDGGPKKHAGPSETITNLMAYDVDAIWSSRDFVLVCTAAPIEVAVAVFFLYRLFGPSALVALAVLLLSVPLATVLARRLAALQRALMATTDRRVALVAEYLAAIRTVKVLAWEAVLAARVDRARAREERCTWSRNLAAAAVAVLGDAVPLVALFSMFSVDVLARHRPLTPARAFTAVALVETLRLQFVWMANVTRFAAQARVAFARIDAFMRQPETVRPPPGPPAFYGATVRRGPPAAPDSGSPFRLTVDVRFAECRLNVIAGPSGGGKSSLLLALLGEAVLERGRATCPRDVAYAPQVPWLVNVSVRDNICLHAPWDAARYGRVVAACALRPDLARLAAGDRTPVGVDGANLSGGQRQRVGLARALYARSALLLLDDVFSALDAATQKHVWQNAFHPDVLQGRTVILVTQMQAVLDAADLVLTLAHGRVVSITQGEGRQVPSTPPPPQQTEPTQPPDLDLNLDHNPDSDPAAQVKQTEAKVDQEVHGQQRNPRLLFWHYMLFFGGRGRAILALVLCLLSQLAFFGLPLWLAVWVGASPAFPGYYVAVYGLGLVAFAAAAAASQVYLQWGARTAAHTLHARLVRAALGVPVRWYDANPPGRFLNRFAGDIHALDAVLVDYLRVALDNVFRFALRLAAIGAILPVFALPAAAVCAAGLVAAEMYTRAQLSVKALASAAQSPVFSFFGESLAGRAVVRARGAGSSLQAAFADDLAQRLRVYVRADETHYNLNRWISVRADACAALIALATGVLALAMGGGAPAGRLGFSLTSAIGLGQTILTMVRNMNELESELNCFHRVREYAELPLEEEGGESLDEEEEEDDGDDDDVEDEDAWPAKGRVEFRHATVHYDRAGPPILHDLSLVLAPGERVAVVGRTGSGKSTLALSLLGFTHVAAGAVLVDGVDIATLPRRRLRSCLTILPQDPVLFAGSVRFNLDPEHTAPDAELAAALATCAVGALSRRDNGEATEGTQAATATTTTITAPPSLDLDTPVAPRGANFSVGQRQVLSLARAAVRRAPIVVLDEATASLDHAADTAVQHVLRAVFRGKTLLAIVHRLATVLDYDRVVVLDGGAIREVGPPLELYRRGGAFTAMVRQSIGHGKGGEWTEAKLRLLGWEDGSDRP